MDQKEIKSDEEKKSNNILDSQDKDDKDSVEEEENNQQKPVWYIICSPFLTKEIKDKMCFIDRENALNIFDDNLLPVDVSKCLKDSIKGEAKYSKVETSTLIFGYQNIYLEYNLGDIEKSDIINAIKQKLKPALINNIFLNQNKSGFNDKELFTEDNSDHRYYQNINYDMKEGTLIYNIVACSHFQNITYTCRGTDSNYTKHGKIVLIGNSTINDKSMFIGHLGSLHGYNLKDIISFSQTIYKTAEIYNILNNEDKQKVETIYENAVEIDKIFDNIHYCIANSEESRKNKEYIQKDISGIIERIDKCDIEQKTDIDALNNKINVVYKEKYNKTLQKVCRRLEKIYRCLDNSKHADVCKAIYEYNQSKIDQVIENKETEKNTRWGCIMKKRINEQIAYLNKMRENPLLYNSRIIDEISQRTPDSYTVSPCNFVQPWRKKENLTEVQKEILSNESYYLVAHHNNLHLNRSPEPESIDVSQELDDEVLEALRNRNGRPNASLGHANHQPNNQLS